MWYVKRKLEFIVMYLNESAPKSYIFMQPLSLVKNIPCLVLNDKDFITALCSPRVVTYFKSITETLSSIFQSINNHGSFFLVHLILNAINNNNIHKYDKT